MKEKIENLIKEMGVKEVESILNEMKSKVNVKELLKKDFIELISGCTISFDGNIIKYNKNNRMDLYYRTNDNYFYISYKNWRNFELKYNLKGDQMKNLIKEIVEEVLNYKIITPKG